MMACFDQSTKCPLFIIVHLKHHTHLDIQVVAMPKLSSHDSSTTYGNALTNLVVTDA